MFLVAIKFEPLDMGPWLTNFVLMSMEHGRNRNRVSGSEDLYDTLEEAVRLSMNIVMTAYRGENVYPPHYKLSNESNQDKWATK